MLIDCNTWHCNNDYGKQTDDRATFRVLGHSPENGEFEWPMSPWRNKLSVGPRSSNPVCNLSSCECSREKHGDSDFDGAVGHWYPSENNLRCLRGGFGWCYLGGLRQMWLSMSDKFALCLCVGAFRSFLVLAMVDPTAEYIIGIDIFGFLQHKTSL